MAGPHGAAPISEDVLVDCLARAEAANGGELITLFEITTAAAFLAFAEAPADLLLLETGLGGRLDATNMVEPSRCSPSSRRSPSTTSRSSVRHSRRSPARRPAFSKPGVPCVVGRQEAEALDVIEAPRRGDRRAAACRRARFRHVRAAWAARVPDHLAPARPAAAAPRRAPSDRQCGHGDRRRQCHFWRCARPGGAGARDDPRRIGRHGSSACRSAALHAYVGEGTEIWLDGGHNEAGGQAIAHALAELDERVPRPVHVIWGMMETKDAQRFIAPFKGLVERDLYRADPRRAQRLSPPSRWPRSRAPKAST